LSDVCIVDNNTCGIGFVDIIAITTENTHIHGLASALTIDLSAVSLCPWQWS